MIKYTLLFITLTASLPANSDNSTFIKYTIMNGGPVGDNKCLLSIQYGKSSEKSKLESKDYDAVNFQNYGTRTCTYRLETDFQYCVLSEVKSDPNETASCFSKMLTKEQAILFNNARLGSKGMTTCAFICVK